VSQHDAPSACRAQNTSRKYPRVMADQIDQNVAGNVRRLREQAGLKQADLVAQLRDNGLEDWHPTTLSRTESGERPIRLAEAHVLARVLGTSVEELGINYSPEVRAVEGVEAALQDVARARSVFVAAREEYVEAWKAFVTMIRGGPDLAADDPRLKRRVRKVVERSVDLKPTDEDFSAADDERWEDSRWRSDGSVYPGAAAQDGLQAR